MDKSFRLRGEVAGGPQDLSGLTVELVDVLRHSPIDRMSIARNGTFEFHNVTGGTYQVRVVNQQGTILRQEQVDVNQFTGDMTISIPDMPTEQPSSGNVSVQRLQHKIPSKAKKAFAVAQKKLEAGDSEGSIAK